jgi:hypothetical protein
MELTHEAGEYVFILSTDVPNLSLQQIFNALSENIENSTISYIGYKGKYATNPNKQTKLSRQQARAQYMGQLSLRFSVENKNYCVKLNNDLILETIQIQSIDKFKSDMLKVLSDNTIIKWQFKEKYKLASVCRTYKFFSNEDKTIDDILRIKAVINNNQLTMYLFPKRDGYYPLQVHCTYQREIYTGKALNTDKGCNITDECEEQMLKLLQSVKRK